MRHGKQEDNDGFRHGLNDSLGGDVDGDVALGAGGEVDIVVTNTAAPDGAEAGDAFERLCGDAGLERDDDIVAGELVGRIDGLVVRDEFDVEAGMVFEEGESDIGKREAALIQEVR